MINGSTTKSNYERICEILENEEMRFNKDVYLTKFVTDQILESRDMECLICREIKDEEWGTLKCGHTFHKSCSSKWFSTCKLFMCPLCKDISGGD